MSETVFDGIIKGRAYYFNPNKRSSYEGVEGKYEVLLEVDKKTAEQVKKAGGTVTRGKEVKDGNGDVIELDYSIKAKSNYPIKVIDGAKKSLEDAIGSGLRFGNGTEVAAHINVYTAKPKNGVGVYVVQIRKLVEYTGGGSDGPVDLSGFEDTGDSIADKYAQEPIEDLSDDEIPF